MRKEIEEMIFNNIKKSDSTIGNLADQICQLIVERLENCIPLSFDGWKGYYTNYQYVKDLIQELKGEGE